MTRSHFIEILMILTKYVFDLGVRLTEFSVTVESVTLRFYCSSVWYLQPLEPSITMPLNFLEFGLFYKVLKYSSRIKPEI